jgi:hypothetical protein
MFTDHRVSAPAKEAAKDDSDDEYVVELAGDRNEIGHKVEGKGEISGERD